MDGSEGFPQSCDADDFHEGIPHDEAELDGGQARSASPTRTTGQPMKPLRRPQSADHAETAERAETNRATH
jgi:hypothetical protein